MREIKEVIFDARETAQPDRPDRTRIAFDDPALPFVIRHGERDQFLRNLYLDRDVKVFQGICGVGAAGDRRKKEGEEVPHQ
jgi:hypothetical protein